MEIKYMVKASLNAGGYASKQNLSRKEAEEIKNTVVNRKARWLKFDDEKNKNTVHVKVSEIQMVEVLGYVVQ